MGSIHFASGTFTAAISEVVGYKSGLALTREDILSHLEDSDYLRTVVAAEEAPVRVRAEVFEGIVVELLYAVGRVESKEPPLPLISVFLKYKNDPAARKMAPEVMEMFVSFLNEATRRLDGQRSDIDPTPFLDAVFEKYGPLGAQIGIDLCKTINAAVEASPWSQLRSIEWKDTRELEELFKSESLTTEHGEFFDQRFIDYLHRNFDRIDEINWRQFEGITAEFFARLDFRVEVGPGRNDGGIDIRIWPNREVTSLPPAILVQCKRQREKIGKVVVKALYADILDEDAQSGLIVTSSTLAPGAAKVLVARNYPIQQANRESLKQWIAVMRKPGTGVFLGQ